MVYFLIFQKQLRNVKSLDAYDMQQEGWVRKLFYKDINGNHLIKSKVRHSMRIREKPLDVWIIMRSDGSVNSAHCTCMAGLDDCCSHVASVLFTLESATKAKREASVTDSPAYWMFPTGARLDVPYKRLKEMDMQSAAKKRKMSLTDSDCQEHQNDIEETDFLNNISSPTKHEEDKFLDDLHNCLPTSAVLSLSEKFSENFIPKTRLNTWPVDLGKLYQSAIASLTYEDLVKKCEMTNITVTEAEIKFLEGQTRKQSDSPFWYNYRIGRVTASNFYAVCSTNPEKPSMSLVKKLCYSEEYHDYVAKMLVKHQNFNCRESGLILSETFPQFGASPDGLTSCDCCGDGCLEIVPLLLQGQCINRGCVARRRRRYNDLWTEMSLKAKDFHSKYIMPELLGRYITQKQVLQPVLPAIQSSSGDKDKTDSGAKYCVCDGDDDGRKMIMCEDENCPKQWYHMTCIRLKRAPKGKWICHHCRK